MKNYKTSESRLVHIFKQARDSWKNRALSNQKRIRFLEKKLRDTNISRESWKNKTNELKTELATKEATIKELEGTLKRKRAQIERLKKNRISSSISTRR